MFALYINGHLHACVQGSEQWMRERAELLKGQVRHLFNASLEALDVADLVTYVDTLERLGLDNHFREVIGAALNRIRAEEPESHGLHIVALRFRLLRQHGIWVSAGICLVLLIFTEIDRLQSLNCMEVERNYNQCSILRKVHFILLIFVRKWPCYCIFFFLQFFRDSLN
jgi:hypothetical protein